MLLWGAALQASCRRRQSGAATLNKLVASSSSTSTPRWFRNRHRHTSTPSVGFDAERRASITSARIQRLYAERTGSTTK